MIEITRSEFLQMYAAMVAGIFANPQIGNVAMDAYAREAIMSQTWSSLIQTLSISGITVRMDL